MFRWLIRLFERRDVSDAWMRDQRRAEYRETPHWPRWRWPSEIDQLRQEQAEQERA